MPPQVAHRGASREWLPVHSEHQTDGIVANELNLTFEMLWFTRLPFLQRDGSFAGRSYFGLRVWWRDVTAKAACNMCGCLWANGQMSF